jgi:uncharacterized OB-fold protein
VSPRTSAESPARQIPIRGAYLRLPSEPGGEATLEGCRCPECDDTFYPPRHICLNCYHEGLERIPLSRRGDISTFTIARLALPGSLISAPYVIVQVKLPEGVVVPSVMTDVDPESIHIGMPVELVVEKSSTDKDGNDVMTYKFRPMEGG